MNNLLKTKKAGSALPLAMLALVILLTLGGGLLSLGLNRRIFSVRTTSKIKARAAADAGLAKALFEMNQKLNDGYWDGIALARTTNESTTANYLDGSALPTAKNTGLPYCGEVFSYIVTGDMASGYTIESIGISNNAQKRVTSLLKLTGPFKHAIWTQGPMVIKADSKIGGYNSSDPTDTNINVRIGTNSTLDKSVVLNSGAVVYGDVCVGPGGSVETAIADYGATVTGDRYAAPDEVEFPPVTPPVFTNESTNIIIQGETLALTPGDSGQYQKIWLKNTNTPTILKIASGDVVLHITGDVIFGQECTLTIEKGASLRMYIDGKLSCGNDSGINNLGPPTSLKIYHSGTSEESWTVNAKSQSLGAIYAPNVDLKLMAKGDVRGAMMCNSFDFMAQGSFLYDKALADAELDDELIRFETLRWSED